MTLTRQFQFISALLGLLLCLGAIWTPLFAALAKQDIFQFTNAFDEVFYLSYQGVLAVKHIPGAWLHHINLLLHEMGLSGAMQNLIFDVTIPLLLMLFGYLCGKRLGLSKYELPILLLLMLFAGLIFSFHNPLWASLDLPTQLAYQKAYFPYFLRTPNPQLSYLVCFVCAWLALKHHNPWYLLPALALSYLFVFLAVLYLFILFWLLQRWPQHQPLRITICTFIAYFTTAIIFWALVHWFGGKVDEMYQTTRTPQFSVMLFANLPLLLLAKAVKADRKLVLYGLHASLMLLCITNFQVVNGFTLAARNTINYVVPVVGGLAVAFPLLAILRSSQQSNRIIANISSQLLVVATITGCIWMTLKSQNFLFDSMAFQIYNGHKISDPQIEKRIFNDPTHAIILSGTLASRISYAKAKTLAPPGSYVLTHMARGSGTNCPNERQWMTNAQVFVQSQVHPVVPTETTEITRNMAYFHTIIEQHWPWRRQSEKSYCAGADYDSKDFYLVETHYDDLWIYFP